MGRAIGRRLVEQGLRVELHDDHFPQGTPDAEWLTVVGERRWVVLTKDTRIRYRPNEKGALLAAGVRAFAFASGNLTGPQMTEAVVKALPKILKLLATHPRAFVARITAASDVMIILEE
jgi:hypothetical protein